MSDQDYTKKLESLRRYIPFLVNMMAELKAKGNREAQLAKIQSLHDMITDTRKKLKLETLKRCEEVLTNIYFKVNPQLRGSKTGAKPDSPTTLPGIESPRSTPQSPSPPRDVILTKPITIPTEKVANLSLGCSAHKSPKSHRPKIDVYSNAVIDNPTKTKPSDIITKVPDMSKPPISLDDLRTLEDDVQQKINDATFVNKSVDELQEVRKQLQLQLRVDEVTAKMSPEKPKEAVINTTVRNNLTFSSKRLSYSESKHKQNKELKSPSPDKKTNKPVIKDSPTSNKSSKKQGDIFGSLLSSIDNKLLEEKKKSKKHERRSSKEDSGSTTSLSSDKSDSKSKDSKDRRSSSDSSKHRRSSIDKDRTKDKKRDESRDKGKTDKSKSETKHHKDNKEKKDEQKVKETKDKDKISSGSKSSSETDILNSSDTSKSELPTFKRLADKYKPKPKQKIVETDVEKSVSDSIEELMKVSPVKGLTSPLGPPQPVGPPKPVGVPQPVPPPKPIQEDAAAASTGEQKKPVQLPDILQKIFSKPLLGDIIPKRLTEPISSLAQNRAQNSSVVMTKPGAIQPPEPPVLSPPHRPLQFKPPPAALNFVSPPQMLSPDMMGRHTHVTSSPAPGIGQMPNTGPGILPTPPIPPNLPAGFMEHDVMNMGYGTPRMDFDTPGTPMPDFSSPSPRVDFDQPGFMRNDQFNVNQQRFMPMEHQMHGFDPRNANFMAQQNMYLNQGHMGYYGANQMPMHNPEVPHYMPDQTFYQERSRWARDRYPGDPRNYKEYKEMKERQEKAAQEKQREIKDPRLALRDPRLSKEANNESGSKEKPETAVRDPRLARPREKSVERPRNEFREDRSRERGSRDRTDDRSMSRESRPRSRFKNSKFDQMYSQWNRGRSRSRSRGREDADKPEEEFMSPLGSLYNAGEKGRTGRGYGVQNFRIPRKPKSVEETRREERNSSGGRHRRRVIEVSDSDESDSNNVDDGPTPDNDSDLEVDKSETKDELDKEVKNDVEATKIEVVIKPGDDFWKTDSSEDFKSEYDKEFENETKHSVKNEEPISTSSPKCANQVENNSSETKVQVEEPSSSQDVVEQSPKIKQAETDTFTKPAEPDSSKKADGAATPQETTSKNDEPSEQNILAHFFQNLLKSSNKNDKKTALFSLIETFSDSFEDKEIQKIRKIIKANDEPEATSDEEKEEAGAAKAETEQESSTKQASSVQEEQPVVGSTTTEEEIKDATPETEAAKSSINETQVHEVSKSTDESELQDTEQEKSEESLNETKDRSLEPVMVSVGERIKNRRRKKVKTELDLLHENIQEMFIRDGVLTATGKRMCRILKDDPNVLANDSDQAPPATVTEEQPKKIRRKPGPKPKQKPANLDNSHSSMKDMRVVIKKMPDEVLNTTTRQLRNRTRQSSYAEDEADSILDNASFASSIDGESDKSDLEGESANESEEEDKSSLGTEVIRKPRGKRRKVPKWASGIISKVKKKKTPQSKSKENSPERIPTPALSATSDVASISEFDLEPDKDYYYDYTNRRKLKCKLCKYSGHFLTGHYLKEHPHSEVLCSRFAPEKAIEAIKDISENGEILERIAASNLKSKFNYSCRMCGYTSCISSIFFYEHVTTHTGEYRHQCGICEYSAVTSKTMKVHFAAIHPDQEKKVIVKTYSPPVVFAYICEDCNFVQMKEKSVQDHVNIFHLGKKPSIHKINMSTTIDPALKAFVDKLSAETDSAATPEIADDKAEETPKRRKPGPKSKKAKALEAEEKAKEMAAEEEKDQTPEEKQDNASTEQVTKEDDTEKDTTTPVRRKRPGPKSKTLPVPEADTPTLTEEVEVRSLRKRAGPKPKTLTSKVAEEFIEDTAQQPLDAPTPPPENVAAKEVPARKRRRSLDKLINEDSGDDLDTIITLSSRSSRAAKEKATAKLKTLMENNEGMPTKRKSESETPKKDKEIEAEPQEADKEAVREEEAVETQNEQHQVAAMHPPAVNNDETSVEAVINREEEAVVETQNEQHQVTAMHPPAVNNTEEEAVVETQNQQHQVTAMHPPAVNNDATSVESNDKDLNVFTCKNDILQNDAKEIEEERLRKMNELNKSIVSRTLKHDFINKLSNRLTNEEQSNEISPVQVKAEPKDTSNDVDTSAAPGDTSYEPIMKTPPISKVNKSPVLSRKPVLEEESTVQQPSIKFRQNKPNSLFSNMIEKLQGKVNEAAVQEDSSNLESSVDETTSNDSQTSSSVPEVFISIGDLIRATKTDKEIIYSCHANKCYVATKDKMVFQLHCKFGHKELNLKSSLCEKCGVVVEVTPDTTLLENLYDHLVFAHSDFLSRSTLLRMRRLSGDKLSIKKEIDAAPAAPATTITEPQDFEVGIERHYVSEEGSQQSTDVPMETAPTAENEEQPAASEATLELAEDNPFSFKIESVMSLADSNDSASPIKATAKVPTEASPKPPLPPLKHVPPLTLIGTGPKPTGQSLIVKEAKLTPQELSRPKKAQKALQKFIDCPQDLYKCPHFYCMFSTKVRTLMMCHLRAHKCDNDTMVPCVYCDMKTPWKDVPMHIELRHANCKYSCYYCMYRAALREYVCLHQEQCHPNLDYVIICLQIHKSVKKFSVADPKTDLRTLLEPYRCFCKDKEDGESVVHEYLFEKEFLQHLSNAHPHEFLVCGYPKCTQKELGANMMLNHWAMFHGVCVYQCGHCKTSSNNIARMYLHFSQNHPSLPPNILVRKNDFLPQDREVRFTDEAFKLLGHIKKISPALVSSIAKRTQRNVKLIQLDNPNGPSEEATSTLSVAPTTTTTASSASVLRPTTASSASILRPSPSVLTTVPTAPKLHVPTSNVKLIVATSVNNDKLYLLPASMMAPVTSTAPMSKVIVQTSSASSELLKAAAETAPQQPVKFGGITLYPSDESQIYKPVTNQEASLVTAISSLVTSTPSVASSTGIEKPLLAAAAIEDKEPKMTAKIKSISKISRVDSPINNAIAQENEARDDLASENDSIALSEDDMLQSAIQSILDQEDDDSTNSNTRLESNITNTSSEKPRTESPSSLLPGIMLDPPPLVLFNNSTSAVAATPPRPSTPVEAHTEAVTPVEHVDVVGRLSPLINAGSDEGSNSEIPFFNDNDDLDPLSEDPLTITPTLNTALPDDPLRIEEPTMDKDPLHEVQAVQQPVIHPPESVVATQEPLKIATMQRSASMVSNSDDESDSGASEKKKRGLIGYQLFRCAVCNLSFSNVRPFKSHIISSQTCKKPGFRAFHCVHCDKRLKTPQRLGDHIMTHGLQRFSCSLCNEKFTTVAIAKLHMKNRHSIHQTSLLPLNPAMNDMETDNFVIKPGLANVPIPKDKETASESPKPATDDLTYTPELIDSIPIRQIFSSNVKCGLCNYQTKVRVNIIRHLQMHLEEKAVSDTAPVNPVPCLEKNEKMFDKMINLAASSITTAGRMGGSVKDKEKEEEQHPEFIPTHRRFVCCAQGCSYLCPEEANLKHHLMALHSDETNFTCAHCKVKIEPKDIESVIKHFKVHGLHLYKCQYCSFIHHLKHKVERHISDGHLDMAVKVVTIRCMESEPQEFVPQEEVAPTPPPTSSSKFKPWNCGMCKAKYHTREDIQAHIIKKHNIDAQYKCTLCAFKNDEEDSFKAHFQEKHPSHELDMIFVYQKIEEELPKDDSGAAFDTTPLWQRDKPRVRHIRGILFDESSPPPTKSPKKLKTYGGSSAKASANTTPKASPVVSVSSSPKITPSTSTSVSPTVNSASKNLFDCIEAVARGTAETLMNMPGSSGVSPTKKASSIQETAANSSAVVPPKLPERRKSVSAAKREEIKAETLDDDVVVIPQTSSIIVIDSDESDSESAKTAQSKDDDTPKSKDKDSKIKPMAKNRGVKRQGGVTDLLEEAVKMAKIKETDDEDYIMAANCSAQNLISLYGELGTPHNKQWKCPKCKKFKSKRVGDFMFHIYKDFNTYRYRCKVCLDLSITYKYMQDHIKLHAGCNEDIIEPLTPDIKLETWIHMVVREQSLIILKNGPLFKKRPVVGQTDITCYFCSDKFMSMPECCEHMLYHWVMMPYQCQHCPNEFYTIYDLKHHHKIEHPDARLYTEPKGPTLSRAIQCIENPKKRPAKFCHSLAFKKKPRLDDASKDPKMKKEEITSGIVINAQKGKKPQKPSPTTTDDVITLDDDEDDLVIVSKTDDHVPNDDNVFACDMCVYITESEILVMKHLAQEHGVRANKFHILSKTHAETESGGQKMACNICDEVFMELKLRRHFIQNHFKGQTYAPYRFKCLLCSAKFLVPSRIKVHFARVHPDSRISYQCIIPSMKSSEKKAKHKQYCCTFCSYSTVSTTTVTIRSHLKGHLKPMLCTYCNGRFRYHSEVVAHSAKEHPEQKAAQYVTLDDVMTEFSETMKLITERAVVLSDDYGVHIMDTPLKSVAKKSTSAPRLPLKAGEDEAKPELDLTKISTTFELDQLEYTTTAEQMLKMFNMDTYVDMSGCLVDIMPLDNS